MTYSLYCCSLSMFSSDEDNVGCPENMETEVAKHLNF